MLLLKLQCHEGSDQKFTQNNGCLNNTKFWFLNYSFLGGLELPHQIPSTKSFSDGEAQGGTVLQTIW